MDLGFKIAACVLFLVAFPSPGAAQTTTRDGRITFQPLGDGSSIPSRFRLSSHQFPFQQSSLETVSRQIRISTVTFPSPVKTEHPANNTVHCEYFRPAAPGNYPGVIALHILGGDFDLSRLFCRAMAHHGVCALFLKMPYYGPRRPPGARIRMVRLDTRHTIDAMTQAVLDIRRAAAWLGQQEEVDEHRLGVFGISLGGVTSALAASAEPRLKNVYLMLAGGDLGTLCWKTTEFPQVRKLWQAAGRTELQLGELLEPIDPARYGRRVRGRRIAMLNARFDTVMPRECTLALWESLGRPPITWLDCGHYTSARFMLDAVAEVTRFFQESPRRPAR